MTQRCGIEGCERTATGEPWHFSPLDVAYFCEFHLAWLKRQMKNALQTKADIQRWVDNMSGGD